MTTEVQTIVRGSSGTHVTLLQISLTNPLADGCARGGLCPLWKRAFLAMIMIVSFATVTPAQNEQNVEGRIGVVLTIKDGIPVIKSLVESMPAFKAGLRPGDRIFEIDGKSTDKLNPSQVSQLVRGAPGTKVSLTILTADGKKKKITLKRAIPTQEYVKELEQEQDQMAEAAEAEFMEKARGWRALPVKPELPEETKKQRVLAENAIHENRFEDALAHYVDGLVACDQLWPEGNFNCAILVSELCERQVPPCIEELFTAVLLMQRYLELVPDAPDAQAAKEKIYIWQDKADRAKAAGGKK